MKARVSFALVPVLIALVAIAGCGSAGNSSSTGPAIAGTPVSSGGGSATVDVANNPQLGKILVDAGGRTLYMFQKDTGSQSMCTGSCASIWPALTASGRPRGSGVDTGMLGTTRRSDGSTQVTYGGHPLYTYSGDSGPGQTAGNGLDDFGAVWNAVLPSGAKAPAGGSSGDTSPTSSGGGGYGY
jgi:predicted lipoprotein with Yx(FWY)xxD motif